MISPASWWGWPAVDGVPWRGRTGGCSLRQRRPTSHRSGFLKHYVQALSEAGHFISKHTSCFLPQSLAPRAALALLVSWGRSQMKRHLWESRRCTQDSSVRETALGFVSLGHTVLRTCYIHLSVFLCFFFLIFKILSLVCEAET